MTLPLTPEILASANHSAFTTLLNQLRKGSLVPELPAVAAFVPIGLGHSMGAIMTVVQQAHDGTYAAVVNLGFSGDGLAEHARDPEWLVTDASTLRRSLVDMARVQFDGPPAVGDRTLSFRTDDVPSSVRDAFRRQQTNLIPSCALASFLPSFSDPELGAIPEPLFLGFGEHDLADPHGSVGRYRASSDITLVVLAGSGRCHNQASNRRQLWQRIWTWARSAPLVAS